MLKHLVYKVNYLGIVGNIYQAVQMSTRKMSWVSVRKVLTENRIQISFLYAANRENTDGNSITKARNFNLDRLSTEQLDKTLARIQANVSKLFKRKNKTKKAKDKVQLPENSGANNIVDEEIVAVRLLSPSGEEVEGNVENAQAWEEGSKLIIGGTELPVRINVPLIKELILPHCIMAGFTAYPKLDAEFVDITKCHFIWYREKHNCDQVCEKEAQNEEWIVVCESLCYLPSNTDINHRLKLSCTPCNGKQQGITKEVVTKEVVTAGPGLCPFENRHEYTKNYTDRDSLRVMTYNILANIYADSDYSRDYLYPYCPAYTLDKAYRKQLLMKEIAGYHGDVLCMQEVDRSLFMNDYLPFLEMQGYTGALCLKAGQSNEGNAIFYRRDKFRLLSQHDIVISKSLEEEPLYRDVWEKVSTNQMLAKKIQERSTVLQVMVLEPMDCPGKKIIVGTTHLYFHPRASHIRILQTIVCLRHLESVAETCTQRGSEKPALIFCGDLNSYPMGGVHFFIDKKHIPSQHADWYAGGKEEFAKDLTFSHDLDLVSACGFPKYTNFVATFAGCLDYIYVERNKFKVTMVVPMPTHEEVTQYTALPNAVFPSDHIALVCDLKWT